MSSMDKNKRILKLETLLLKGDYGRSAAEVLETCALVAEYTQEHTPDQVKAFQEKVSINSQVWLRLLALHRDERLKRHLEHLPASYTTLYAIHRMSDEEVEAAVQQGVIHPRASSHTILSWSKEIRETNSAEVPPWKCLVLPAKELNPADISRMTERFNQVAKEFGCRFVSASDYIPPKKDRFSHRKNKLPALQKELLQLLEPKFNALSWIDKKSIGVSCLQDCLFLDWSAFYKLLFPGLPLRGRLAAQRKYEKDYVLRMAQDFILSDSRSTRFNLKRRLAELQQSVPELAAVIDEVLETYMK
jgi:hypothetical protein